MKPINDMCGRGARKVNVCDGKVFVDKKEVDPKSFSLNGQGFVIQPIVVNHQKIRCFNASTLNTLRIATCINSQGNIELWDSGMIRIGRQNCQVDNFAQGGIGVGISPNGRLLKWGFCHDQKYCYARINRHPDSLIPFDAYEVPFYKEATELVIEAHKLMPYFRTVGWDVAITDTGPVLLEGNHNWDMEMLQVVHGKGSRARFVEIYNDTIKV